ncbi:MAG TPA: phage protease, partial [Lacibacter sp.]|nr:phage protease [Lacibacter sp.]
YEAGIINMSSAGLQPLEVQTETKYLKGNGKAPCLSKSMLAEISLVDIGSNRNALKLYADVNGTELKDDAELVKLFSPTNDKLPIMIELKDVAKQLQLADNANAVEIMEAVKKLQGDVVTLSSEKKTAEDALAALKATQAKDQITQLVDGAVNAKKITAADKPHYEKLAAADFTTTKAILDAMKGYETVEKQLNDDGSDKSIELAEILKLNNDELFEQGKFERLKELSPIHFKLRYKQHFGSEPKDQA